jgi:Sec7-like guanine-nucleotide exchange factor
MQVLITDEEKVLQVKQEYYNAIPRPNKEEFTALKMSIIEKGQQDPITVNKNLIILDGHTRYNIMYERGMEIKYTIKEFESEEMERKYVIESNILRRQMTDFQKVEAVADFYTNLVKERNREKKFNKYIDILEVMDEEKMTIAEISKKVGKHENYLRNMLRTMSNDFYIRIEKVGLFRVYSKLPKSEELIAKEKIKDGSSLEIVGQTIGVSKSNVQRSNYLMKNADKRTLTKLRNGTTTISTAYEIATRDRTFRPKKYISKNTEFKCPSCDKIHRMGDLERTN